MELQLLILGMFPILGLQMVFKHPVRCHYGLYPPADDCFIDYCHNGGTCQMNDWGDASCTCLPGFDGPRCQGTHHSFDGNSYALYDPLDQCEEGRTSLDIITQQENGLIFYDGPTADPKPDSKGTPDFISVELSGGYPRLKIDEGSGLLELNVDGKDTNSVEKMKKLNDGRWHTLDIVRHAQEIELIVDHCDTAAIGPDGVATDGKMCRATVTRNGDMVLNVSSMLQVGGRFSNPKYPPGIMTTRYDGCIRNLMHNGKLYDLTVPGNSSYPSGGNRCTREDDICGVHSQNGSVCGDKGICESTWQLNTITCVCKPGYMGSKCSEDATTKDLQENSFIQWRLKDKFFNNVESNKLKMNMMFRSRDTDGILWTVASTSNNMFVTLQILDGRLTCTYNLGDGIRAMELYHRNVSNGAWHSTVVERNGREFILKMDNGEGTNFNFTYGFPTDRQEMHIENTVFGGASVSYNQNIPVTSSVLEHTCIRDVRMDNEWFPMDVSEDAKSKGATISRARNVEDGCVRSDCEGQDCPPSQMCYPLWEEYECKCQDHYEFIGNVCKPIDYCANHYCFAGSTCQIHYNFARNYQCHCPPGWYGEFCSYTSTFCINIQCPPGRECREDLNSPTSYSCVCSPASGGDCQSDFVTTTQSVSGTGDPLFMSEHLLIFCLLSCFCACIFT